MMEERERQRQREAEELQRMKMARLSAIEESRARLAEDKRIAYEKAQMEKRVSHFPLLL
jgi:hypothetical protein